MNLDRIRNLSIVAHVDHGKSTLSDRILELTGAVDARDMREQYLDSMDIERERGITIKAQNVRVHWKGYTIHLIDTPGHVDFGYEVSRSLAACEGVVLLVDAAQGIEAQTLANAYQALEHDLEIVAALNKIDLPAADPDRYAGEIERVLGVPADEILRMSAKTGRGRPRAARRHLRAHPAARRRPRRPPAGPDLRLLLRPVPGRGQRRAGRQRDPVRGCPPPLHADRAAPTTSRRSACAPRSACPVAAPRPGRGRLPHRRHQGRRRGPQRRDRSPTRPAPPPRPWRATRTPSPWCSAGCTPSTATTSPTCARRWRSCGSTTPPSPTSRRPRGRSGSGFAAGSSACCTWRSSGSASSGSSTCRSSPPPRASSTGPT